MNNPFGGGPFNPLGGQQQRPYGNQLPNFGGGGNPFGPPPPPRRGRGRGVVFAIVCVVILLVLAAFVGAFFFVFKTADETIERVQDAIPTIVAPGTQANTAPGATGSSGSQGAGRAGAGDTNWTTGSNFEKALTDMRSEAGPDTKVALMRVDTGQVWCSCGNAKFSGTLQVTDAGTRVVESGGAITSTLTLEDVDPRAPERMIAALKKTGVAASEVDFMSLLDFGGEPRWSLFLKTTGATPAKMYAADADGRNFRKNG